MGLKEEIIKLVQLQEIDSKIYHFEHEKNIKKPAELEKVKKEFEEKKQIFSLSEEKVKKVQLRKKEQEIELASKEESLRKAQGQLYQLKTNKEYQAKLTEIESLKADISVVEENILKILDELDSVKKEYSLSMSQLNQMENEFKTKDKEIRKEIEDTDIEINKLQSQRATFAISIDAKFISKYDSLLKTRQGLALVPIKRNNCGSCFMRVTHQKINEIKMYEALTFCENCVRILYIPEDIQL